MDRKEVIVYPLLINVFEITGRVSHHLFENPGKIIGIVYADHFSGLADGNIVTLNEFQGFDDPDTGYILQRSEAGDILEQHAEITFGQGG